MADRFEDLRNFVAVAETGGVNAAAARLGIAESAVSRRFSEFERRLGLDLAVRGGRRFELTAAGHSVLADARRLLGDLDRLENRGRAQAPDAVLDVAVHGDLLDVVVAAAGSLGERAFAFRIRLFDDGGAVGTLAFSAASGPASLRTELGRFSRCVFAGAGSDFAPATPADLTDAPAVAVATAGAGEWRLDGVEVSPRVVAQVPDLRSGLAAAAAGLGVVRAPEWAVRESPWRDSLREVLRPRSVDSTVSVDMPHSPDAGAERLVEAVRGRLRP